MVDGVSEALEPGDREQVLGTLFRGACHEYANALNSILMNVELASMCADEPDTVSESLARVAKEARAGGVLVNQLSGFAAATDSCPAARHPVDSVLDLAKRLVGSAPRRGGAKAEWSSPSPVPSVMLEPTAMAIAIAALADWCCRFGIEHLGVSAAGDDDGVSIAISTRGGALPDVCDAAAFRVATKVVCDHRGALQRTSNGFAIQLPG